MPGIYPPFLAPYAPYITLALFFVDGLIFGVAVRSSLKGFVLLIAGVILADFIGLTVVAILARGLLAAIVTAGISLLQSFSLNTIVVTFGIVLWFIGFAVGWVARKK